ncbi:aminotransferase class III-fold pyridoxal phosphate-dependent enzyme [bacterium]|nr:aminotransferase class III-fold pyridoxal phosphate-dependent enzyme [bacterium]
MQQIPSQKAMFLNHLAQTNHLPLMLEIAEAQGSWITDTSGKRYLDLISGISVSALGHNHPSVQKAIIEQVQKHLHVMVYGEFVQSPQVAYAQWLTSQLPPALNNVYFTNSGTEATEGALKLAKRVTGRPKLISFVNAYHGSTQGALSLAGGEWLKAAFRPLLPQVYQIPFNSIEALDAIDEQTACVVVEPVQGEAGTVPANKDFLQALRKKATENGALLIFDEIQCAFGRTGTFCAFEDYAVVPDILLLGKALGGGMPLGAFIASKELMSTLMENPVLGHITTFGGHPVSCAAGLAMAQQLENDQLIAQVQAKNTYFTQAIKGAKVNGKGLLLSVETADFEQVTQLVKHCIARGVITDWFLFNDRSIRVSPPLNISYSELDVAIEVINDGLAAM